ncbi:MAG TPA: hypothetical protein PKD54_14470, partial [Pirellulaceae bacterium]|nr:hypothetical protein [Pirellulaceae bacterium]
PPAINQPPQTRAPTNPGNSSSVPRQGGTTTPPRVAAQPNVVPSTPTVPQIDRAELERRAAQRNQVQDAAPRGGWTQPRSDNARNPSAGTSPPNRAPVQSNPIQVQPQTRPSVAQPARPNRTVEQSVPQVTPRTAPRETPQVRAQPERTTPPARVQPDRSAPPVRVQPERSPPPARVQPERAAPPVRVQPERSAPRASAGGNVAPPRSNPPRAESTQPPRGGWNEQRGGANRNNSRQGGGRNN